MFYNVSSFLIYTIMVQFLHMRGEHYEIFIIIRRPPYVRDAENKCYIPV